MTGPYRTSARVACEHSPAPSVMCDLCGALGCPSCARGGVCVSCIFRVGRAPERSEGGRSGFVCFVLSPLVLAALVSVTAASVSFVSRGRRARVTTEDASTALDSAARIARTTAVVSVLASAEGAPASRFRGASPRDQVSPGPFPFPVRAPSRMDPPLPADLRQLGRLGLATHDPAELLARAERLALSGVDITVLRANLSGRAAEAIFSVEAGAGRITPVDSGGRVVGVRIQEFESETLPILIGLENGDLITSVNGYPIAKPDSALEAYAAVRRARMAVVEVMRGRHRIVVAVTWPRPAAEARPQGKPARSFFPPAVDPRRPLFRL